MTTHNEAGRRRLFQPWLSAVRALCVVLVVACTVAAVAPTGSALAAANQATPLASPDASTETVELTGLVERPATLTVAELQAMPVETVDVTFRSGDATEQHSYRGVRLYAVIEQAGLSVDPERKNAKLRTYVVVTAQDGYEVVVAWGEIDPEFGDAPILLAFEEDGQPLSGEDGALRLVVPTDQRGGRYVSGVVRVEVRDVDSAPRR